jgi:acetyl-CoA C-acetyltransferase
VTGRILDPVPLDPRLPVLIGSGQVTQRAESLDDALEPAALMAQAVERAAADAGLAGVPPVDSVRVVSLLSWRYRDPAHFVAERLGLEPRETVLTTPGGQSPQSLVNVTAAEIQRGQLDLAILTGGETWRTRTRAKRADAFLPWPKLPEGAQPTRTVGDDLTMSSAEELARGLALPVQIYPMFETALRAAAGRGIDEHQQVVSELWARFSAVAAENPYAWIQEAKSAEEIRTPGPDNRMVGLPYPKYMNSNNDVDQAAALLICSVERARALGVAQDGWIFVHAGAECHEHPFVSHRWSYAETPAIRAGGRAVLDLAGLGIDEVEIVDLYSCFPSAVQLGAAALGLSSERQLTRTGGLSFAGGPWNNYVMHAVATVMTELRQRPGATGLVWANGGFVTKHAFGVYGTEPPAAGFRSSCPQDEIDVEPARPLAPPAEAAGVATVEAYTVMHDRTGQPEAGFAACLLADGRRAWGTTVDAGTAAALCEGEWVHREVQLDGAGTLRP